MNMSVTVNITFESLLNFTKVIIEHHYFNSYFIHNITYGTKLIYAYNYNDVSVVKGD